MAKTFVIELEDILTNYEVVASGCWIWLGSISKQNGYGRLCYEGKFVGAHVFFYEHYKGPVPDGKEVGHTCNIEPCVNPDHLVAITHRENLASAGKFKLTDEEVQEIREAQGIPLKVLAELYGVSHRYVVKLRTNYKSEAHQVRRTA